MLQTALVRVDQGENLNLYNGYTDANGFVTITNITPGDYQVKCMKSGYDSKTFDLTVVASGEHILHFHNMRTSNTCLIYGYATYNNDYLYGGHFNFVKPGWQGSLNVREDGWFVNEIPPGTYDVTAVYAGYEDMDLGSWELIDDPYNNNMYGITALDMIPE